MIRSGFTITEVLVSLTVVGLLMSLLVPAVQNARASARLTECRNNLKQVGVAIHVVHDAKQRLSCHHELLYHYGMGVPGYDRFVTSAIYDMGPVFQCPSDPNAMTDGTYFSYLASSGAEFGAGNGYLSAGDGNAEFSRQASEFTDGLSQTVAFSERAILNTADQLNPRDDPKKYAAWLSGPVWNFGEEQQFVEICKSSGTSGVPLFRPRAYGNTHLLTPNTRGCWNNAPVNDQRLQAYIPASSYHPGGVNALFVDGHVSFVSDSIDSKVWQAIGTISGHEVIEIPF